MDQVKRIKAEISDHSRKDYLIRLDVLRGLAILGVFLYHFLGVTFGVDRLKWNGLWLDFNSAPNSLFYFFYPFTFGWVGVPLFFVISGFVIHLSYLNSKNFRIFNFYWRRFWRIYPPYLVVLTSLLAYQYIKTVRGGGQLQDFTQYISNILLIQNFQESGFFSINPVFWSLAVEVQFYLLYPLLISFRKRLGIERVLTSIFLLSIFLRVVAAFLTNWQGELLPSVWLATPILWFDWTLGAYLAERYCLGKRVFSFSWSLTLVLFLVLFVSTFYKLSSVLSFSIATLIMAILLESYIYMEGKLTRIELILIPLGLCSYSFYLLHVPLMKVIINLSYQHLGKPNSLQPTDTLVSVLSIIISFTVVLLISWLVYVSLEKWSSKTGKDLWQSVHKRKSSA